MTTTLNASTAGAGGFIATSDNSGVLALQTAGTTALSIDASQNITTTNKFAKASMPTGSVLQVVNSYTTTTTTTTSASPVDTALSATITPTNSSSKILVFMSSNGQCARVGSSANGDMYFYIIRGSTQLTSSRLGINFGVNTWNDFFPAQNCYTYLDSPATTSATTYKMQISVSSGSLTVPTASFATMTLMEIAA